MIYIELFSSGCTANTIKFGDPLLVATKDISKILLFFFTFIVSPYSFGKTKRYDLNKDGIIDRIDYWKKNLLIKRQEDRNGDKKIDFEIIFFNSKKIKIEKVDSNFDGHFDRIKTFEKFQKKYVKVFYQIDKNFDQTFERTYYETFKVDQQNCIQQFKHEVDSFIRNGLAAAAEVNKGFLPTTFGFSIDQKCLQNWGNDFPNLLKKSIQTSLQCMTRLHEELSYPEVLTAGLRNAKDLIDLVKASPVTIVCSEKDNYNWAGATGHASSSPGKSLESPSVKHPFISINPNNPKVLPASSKNLLELKRTIFHESLHNIGHRHGHGIEFPYACETCCFPDQEKTN